MSIAFPAWSQQIVDLNQDGFGVVTFPGAFSIRRSPLPNGVTRLHEIRAIAEAQFDERTVQFQLITAVNCGDFKAHITPLNGALQAVIPAAQTIGTVSWGFGQEFFFIPNIDRSLWSFQHQFANLDLTRTAELLRSIGWLEPLWFEFLPALF